MNVEVCFEVIDLLYDVDEYMRWKSRDLSVVPDFVLRWGGNGVENGYGYAEWRSAQYFQKQGYNTIILDFDIVSKKSKYATNNEIIYRHRERTNFNQFAQLARDYNTNGYKVAAHLDLFVYNNYHCFFVEAKKDKDTLKDNQARFMYMANHILDIQTKIVHLTPQAKPQCQNFDVVTIEVPDDFPNM